MTQAPNEIEFIVRYKDYPINPFTTIKFDTFKDFTTFLEKMKTEDLVVLIESDKRFYDRRVFDK